MSMRLFARCCVKEYSDLTSLPPSPSVSKYCIQKAVRSSELIAVISVNAERKKSGLTLQETPCSLRKSDVPDVAKMLYPAACSFCTEGRSSTLSLNPPTEKRMFFFGGTMPVEMSALRYASYLSLPKHATSPVDAISTPSTGSAPDKRLKLNCGTFTPT